MDRPHKVSIACCLSVATIVQGAPVVIHDAGNTTPIATYRSVLQGDTPMTRATPQETLTPIPAPQRGVQTSRTQRFRSALATTRPTSSARITPRVEHPNAEQPVFVIDGSASSLAWLRRHREALIALKATGALVGSVSAYQRRVLADTAHGLTLIPSDVKRVAHTYGITHYPVLITAPGATP